ncbi:MFS transporter [Paenibacillus pseudetheri]|uniref:Major facilitator superfamily (MFS) profile domain-containing protein n=1 Tax=Paenibacillus pseudetheri TaxID=2897682 RepID=A0ABM9B765_9BACL|nr:MFS transporter [Paenibacillus pseudetheri]CAH1054440.1 hypothetical protein PAECIP111894_00585 [Paenibacillus pseudetheri]
MNDKIVMPLWTMCLFIVVMNTTMFNVSLPTIIQDLQISADLGSWVISSYSIGYALSTVIYSRLSDPIVGGVISQYFGWNGLFGITCLVLIVLPVLLRLLPRRLCICCSLRAFATCSA